MKIKIISGIFFIIFLMGIGQSVFADGDFDIGDTAKCSADVLNIRDKPSTMANRVGKLKEGERVTIKSGPISKDGYLWYEINSGWVVGKYLELDAKQSQFKYAFVDVDSKLMLRSKPSVQSKILSRLNNGTRVQILDESVLSKSHDWIKVNAEGSIGYVSKEYLKFEGQLSQRKESLEEKIPNNTQSISKGIVEVKDIQFKPNKDRISEIEIITSNKANYEKHILEQADKRLKRIVLDLKGSEIKGIIDEDFDGYPVDKIWVGPLSGKKDVVRVVVTLNQDKDFHINELEDKYGLQINFEKDKNSGKTIVVDPGHGGDNNKLYNGRIGDSGSISPFTNTKEKDLALTVSLKLREVLKSRGYNVVMTREKDEYIDLYKRSDIANAANADAFVSIHFNSTENISSATGIETLYCPSNKKTQTNPKDQYAFAKIMQDTLASGVNRKNRGLLNKPGYVVVREPNMPSVLMELGFLTNKEEERLVRTKDYQNRAVKAIADGLDKYFSQ
ncbi:N-acetylmuramoyl-L-alanine amidase [Clostridiisalibacter paucivorans]|uniref:N-acetylmuramoyl-L-alanine amidase n=1 Tax=Clostridiisalibacter paucivorans TaxID=408753 RepID=UPI000684CDEC|nr:N-acetylmuramoyl-L-alanine amidase [Clostridiisalibacter paucivorans]